MPSEEQMILAINNGFIAAKPFYNAVRSVRDKLPLVSIEIEEFTFSDKFIIYLLTDHIYSGGGTLNKLPKDILDFQRHLFEIKYKKES